MTAPDQTNAEVSDERLRDDPLTNKLPMQDEIETILFRRSLEGTLMGGTLPTAHEIAQLLERRSVTSQASEGAVVAWRIRERPGFPWQFVDYDPARMPNVRGWEHEPLYASPSKRVERLETALRPFGKFGALIFELGSGWSDDDVLDVEVRDGAGPFYEFKASDFRAALQALQGGRS